MLLLWRNGGLFSIMVLLVSLVSLCSVSFLCRFILFLWGLLTEKHAAWACRFFFNGFYLGTYFWEMTRRHGARLSRYHCSTRYLVPVQCGMYGVVAVVCYRAAYGTPRGLISRECDTDAKGSNEYGTYAGKYTSYISRELREFDSTVPFHGRSR